MRYQWISTLCPSPDALLGDKMLLSFLVPASLLLMLHEPAALDTNRDTKMGTQKQQVPKPRTPAICDVDGCSEKGKYRLGYREGEGGLHNTTWVSRPLSQMVCLTSAASHTFHQHTPQSQTAPHRMSAQSAVRLHCLHLARTAGAADATWA